MIKLSQAVYEILESQYDEDELRPDYSGRGMYGATCLAYTGDYPTLFSFELARTIAELNGSEADVWQVQSVLESLGEPSKDSMGLGSVYYWRGIQVEGYERESRF